MAARLGEPTQALVATLFRALSARPRTGLLLQAARGRRPAGRRSRGLLCKRRAGLLTPPGPVWSQAEQVEAFAPASIREEVELPYAWLCESPRLLRAPLRPMRGSLGLWRLDAALVAGAALRAPQPVRVYGIGYRGPILACGAWAGAGGRRGAARPTAGAGIGYRDPILASGAQSRR